MESKTITMMMDGRSVTFLLMPPAVIDEEFEEDSGAPESSPIGPTPPPFQFTGYISGLFRDLETKRTLYYAFNK
jgi:hypothetical protein